MTSQIGALYAVDRCSLGRRPVTEQHRSERGDQSNSMRIRTPPSSLRYETSPRHRAEMPFMSGRGCRPATAAHSPREPFLQRRACESCPPHGCTRHLLSLGVGGSTGGSSFAGHDPRGGGHTMRYEDEKSRSRQRRHCRAFRGVSRPASRRRPCLDDLMPEAIHGLFDPASVVGVA